MAEVRGWIPEVMTTGGVKVELQLNAKVLDTAEAEVLAVVLISECELQREVITGLLAVTLIGNVVCLVIRLPE